MPWHSDAQQSVGKYMAVLQARPARGDLGRVHPARRVHTASSCSRTKTRHGQCWITVIHHVQNVSNTPTYEARCVGTVGYEVLPHYIRRRRKVARALTRLPCAYEGRQTKRAAEMARKALFIVHRMRAT